MGWAANKDPVCLQLLMLHDVYYYPRQMLQTALFTDMDARKQTVQHMPSTTNTTILCLGAIDSDIGQDGKPPSKKLIQKKHPALRKVTGKSWICLQRQRRKAWRAKPSSRLLRVYPCHPTTKRLSLMKKKRSNMSCRSLIFGTQPQLRRLRQRLAMSFTKPFQVLGPSMYRTQCTSMGRTSRTPALYSFLRQRICHAWLVG